MSISNDHYYDHVSRYIVDHNITWPGCAPCCTVWSTMLVYPLEAPNDEGRNLVAPILASTREQRCSEAATDPFVQICPEDAVIQVCPEDEGGPEVVASFGCTWQPAFSTRTMQPLRFLDAMRWSKMAGLWKVSRIRKMQSTLCL